MVQAGAVAAGQGGVVHGLLAVHPGGVRDAVLILDVLGDAEAEALKILAAARDVRGDLVEVVETDQLTGGVEVVTPGEAFDVLDVVEELDGKPSGSFTRTESPIPLDEAVLAALHTAAQLAVVLLGAVDFRRGLLTR